MAYKLHCDAKGCKSSVQVGQHFGPQLPSDWWQVSYSIPTKEPKIPSLKTRTQIPGGGELHGVVEIPSFGMHRPSRAVQAYFCAKHKKPEATLPDVATEDFGFPAL
jgi:hypothetical protein